MLLIGGVVAVLLTGIAPTVSSGSRFVSVAFAGLAVLLALSCGWLVLYAAGPDTYYVEGVSRWEHAERFLGTAPVVVAVIAAMATSVGLIAASISPARPVLRFVVAPAAALSCGLLLVGWFALTAGH
jgi:hypothetical protein